MFTSLVKADLSNNKNIKPTIITNLSQSVTELNLQNTKWISLTQNSRI